MVGIVLAGGESRRMGTDKAFLRIAGQPMIEHVLRSLRDVFRDVIIVTNSPDLYRGYQATVVTDVFDQRGPLTGIYTGLLRSDQEYNFVVGCDMPFLNSHLIGYMAGLADGHDVVVPSVDGLFEPLHAVYRKGLLGIMEEHLRNGRKRVVELFGTLDVRYVTGGEIDRFDPLRKSFKNLNTPEEYEEAACAD